MTTLLVKDYMTKNPHSIGHDQHIEKAQELMRSHSIRHLPVLKHGEIIGVISDRDIKLANGLLNST